MRCPKYGGVLLGQGGEVKLWCRYGCTPYCRIAMAAPV